MKTDTILKIKNEEIDVNNWLTSLKKSKFQKNVIELEVYDYTDLGCKIKSLLSICSFALENQNIENSETGLDFSNVLSIVSDLIPMSELELLDKMIE